MPQPQPISNELVEQLNALRKEGEVRQFDLSMARLKKALDSLSNSEPRAHRAMLSAFYALLGDWDQMRSHGLASVRAYGDDEVRIFYATTLVNTGFYSEAASVMGELDWSSPDLFERKLSIGSACWLFESVMEYTRVCERAELPIPEHIGLDMIQAVREILARRGVDERTVCGMMDLAGELLRERGLLRDIEATIIPYPEDGTVTILQPVHLPASAVAEMDWEYGMRLFDRMPDAPATVVHVGFTMAPSK